MDRDRKIRRQRVPWNKRKLIGQKAPLTLREIGAIRVRLQLARPGISRFLILGSAVSFAAAISLVCGYATWPRVGEWHRERSSCGVRDIALSSLSGLTKRVMRAWITQAKLTGDEFLFPSRLRGAHLSTRQYANIADARVSSIGLDANVYGTHTMRRTKETLIYRRTKNLRAVQLLLGHTKLESTVRYLGIEVDDALEIGGADRRLGRLGDRRSGKIAGGH
jgi:integrase